MEEFLLKCTVLKYPSPTVRTNPVVVIGYCHSTAIVVAMAPQTALRVDCSRHSPPCAYTNGVHRIGIKSNNSNERSVSHSIQRYRISQSIYVETLKLLCAPMTKRPSTAVVH